MELDRSAAERREIKARPLKKVDEDVVRALGGLGLLTALLLAGSSAALAQDVTFNYEPGTDFSKYHTYVWATVEGAQNPDQISDKQDHGRDRDGQLAGQGADQGDRRRGAAAGRLPGGGRAGAAAGRLRVAAGATWRYGGMESTATTSSTIN